jgi:hypothetical protein
MSTAFQSDAFQIGAFQIDGGPVEVFRSGWWRMMLAEVQQKALDERDKAKDAAVAKNEPVVEAMLGPAPVAKKAKSVREYTAPPVVEKPFLPKPFFPVNRGEDYDYYGLWSYVLSSPTFLSRPQAATKKSQTQKVAVEDDDEEAALVLLLSA